MFDRKNMAAKGDPEHFKNQIAFKDVVAFHGAPYNAKVMSMNFNSVR
jgi:hypothetical protein